MDLESPQYAGEGMYRENIMDHYSHPRNKGEMANAEIAFSDSNPVCGDEITWFAKIESDRIKEIKFTSKGCAISQSSASMLSEIIVGKTTEQVIEIKDKDVFEMLGIKLSPMRVKCALLGLRALQKAIIKYKGELNVDN